KCESEAWRAMHEIAVQSGSTGAVAGPSITPATKRSGVSTDSLTVRAQDKGGIPHNGTGNGKPTEVPMKKAGSFKADVRTLPQTTPEKIELPELEAPDLNPELAEPPVTSDGVPRIVPQSYVPRLLPTAQAPPTIANFAGLDFQNWGA